MKITTPPMLLALLVLLAAFGGDGSVVLTSGSTTIAIGDFDTDPIDQDPLKLADALDRNEPVFTRSQVTTEGRVSSVVIDGDFKLAIIVEGRTVAALSDSGLRPQGQGDRQALGLLAAVGSDYLAVVNFADDTPRAAPVGGSLDYSTYGVWVVGDGLDLSSTNAPNRSSELAAFYGGTVIPLSDMPQSGRATFDGGAIAARRDDLSGSTSLLTGPVSFDVDFGHRELAGDISLRDASGTSGVRLSAGTMRISGNTFEGTIAGDGLSGGLSGAFFGERASELAGTFDADGDGAKLRGGFGARRD